MTLAMSKATQHFLSYLPKLSADTGMASPGSYQTSALAKEFSMMASMDKCPLGRTVSCCVVTSESSLGHKQVPRKFLSAVIQLLVSRSDARCTKVVVSVLSFPLHPAPPISKECRTIWD